MNQIERMFRDCDFYLDMPYEEDDALTVQFKDHHLKMTGEITLKKNVDFGWFSKTTNKTTIRKLNQFINVVLAYIERYKVVTYRVHQWLKHTNWYQKEGGE